MMTDFDLREANRNDIFDIMKIENDAFALGIREKEPVFLERVCCYPKGFILLEQKKCVKQLENSRETRETVGYFSSEIWNSIPINNDAFTLGHSALNCHCPEGTVLYISSYGILKKLKGQGLGKEFFRETVKHILLENSNLKELVLLVNEDWKSAVHIYESFGFVKYDTIKGFFCVNTSATEVKVTDGYLMKCSRETILEKLI